MGKILDLTGERFTRIKVISLSGIEKNKAIWNCKCDCGNEKKISGNSLRRGVTKSCGCLHVESSINNIKGRSKERTRIYLEGKIHPLYSLFNNMKQRCFNKKIKNYRWYGEKGVSIFTDWVDYPYNFIKWCEENGYQKGLHLDRIDRNGNYEPKNCQFITRIENLKKIRKDNLKEGKIYSRGRVPIDNL